MLHARRRQARERDEIFSVSSRGLHSPSSNARQMNVRALEYVSRLRYGGYGRGSIAFGKRGVKPVRGEVKRSGPTLRLV